jgi:hypothetical protein
MHKEKKQTADEEEEGYHLANCLSLSVSLSLSIDFSNAFVMYLGFATLVLI